MIAKDFSRVDRVSGLIQRKLAQIIQTEIKDPRLPRFITVSAVKVTSDMSIAKVYITIFGEHMDKDMTLGILNKSAGYLRTALARSMKLRIIPNLRFVYDESIEYGNNLRDLIAQANASNEETHISE